MPLLSSPSPMNDAATRRLGFIQSELELPHAMRGGKDMTPIVRLPPASLPLPPQSTLLHTDGEGAPRDVRDRRCRRGANWRRPSARHKSITRWHRTRRETERQR